MLKDRIKELREKNNLTLAAFARSLGISPTSASLYESGKQNPGKKTIAKICEVYGVDEAWLRDTADKAVESPSKETKTVAGLGVRKVAEEAGVAWQTVNKWKEDSEKEAAQPETAEVENDLLTLKAIQDVMEKIADDLEEKVEEIAEDFEKAVEGRDTPEEIEEAITEVIEMSTQAEAERKPEKDSKKKEKGKKKSVNIIIQSPMGGDITPEQILAKIPTGADSVYVRVDENKLYWVMGDETGAVDIWG